MEMDNLNRAYKAQCKELERLAVAAASMNYSHSISGQNIHGVSQQQQPPTHHPQSPNSHNHNHNHNHIVHGNPVPHSLASSTAMPISFVDSYQLPMQRGPTFSNIHSFESSQSFDQESSQGGGGFAASSRLVMPPPPPHQTTAASSSYSNRPITHFALSAMPSLHFPNNNLGISESQIHVPHHHPQVLNFAPTGANLTALPNAEIDSEEQTRIAISEGKHSRVGEPPPQLHHADAHAHAATSADGIFLDSVNKKEDKSTLIKENKLVEDIDDCEKAVDSLVDSAYFCPQCDVNFDEEEKYAQHCSEHGTQIRRTGLALETKVEIIKRILSGEKRMDMAEEYGVNRSTIKSIMKKRNTYLNIWKKGMYNPCAKRLKGPKREDVEEATHRWYLQAIKSGDYISGPVLCSKALDFAAKLDRPDFKPTHGWLDRFKKRKNIVFGRKPSKAKRELMSGKENLCQRPFLICTILQIYLLWKKLEFFIGRCQLKYPS